MFAQRGVAEPVDYVESNTWNRETFLQVAKKLTYDAAGRGTPTHFGYFGFTEWQPMWISYIRHAGGDVITSDGRSGLNMAETIESLEWLNDLNVLHGVTAHPGPGGASWESGTIAMHIRWQSAGLVEKNLYPAVDPEPAPIPAGPKGIRSPGRWCPGMCGHVRPGSSAGLSICEMVWHGKRYLEAQRWPSAVLETSQRT